MNEKFFCDELKRLKSKKATGLDGMSARLLKDAAPVIAKPITYIINLTISTGEIPPELKEAKVTPIFKNGKRTEESNCYEFEKIHLHKLQAQELLLQYFYTPCDP